MNKMLMGVPHPSRLKLKHASRVYTEGVRWSPVAITDVSGGGDGVGVLGGVFRVGGWWSWSPASTTATTGSTPADGGIG